MFAVQGEILGEGLVKARSSVLYMCACTYLYVNITAVA